MINVHIYDGKTKIEKDLGTLEKAERFARENMGDVPTAFAWLQYGAKRHFTILPGGQKMTEDLCGRDAWAALNKPQEVSMPEQIEIQHQNPQGETVAKSVIELVQDSFEHLTILEFEYTNHTDGKTATRRAIFSSPEFTTRDGSNLKWRHAIAELRSDDKKFKEGGNWENRRFFVADLKNVRAIGKPNATHPAAFWLTRTADTKKQFAELCK